MDKGESKDSKFSSKKKEMPVIVLLSQASQLNFHWKEFILPCYQLGYSLHKL